MRKKWSFFSEKYQQIPRLQREQVMCSMIRVNYGTPWDGDVERLKVFFPPEHHASLTPNGLTDLIHNLSPLTNEPTNHQNVSRDVFEGTQTILDGELTDHHGDDGVTSAIAYSGAKLGTIPTVKNHLT